MHGKHPWIDSPRQAVSNGGWHTMWFFTIEDICPLKDDHVRYGQEAQNIRIGNSLKSTLILQ